MTWPEDTWGRPGTPAAEAPAPRSAPIIPAASVAGNALVIVVAIMTFLGAVAIGAVWIVRDAAREWRAEVNREITIQVRPTAGRDVAEDVRRVADLALGIPGVVDVKPYSQRESEELLEPWLGTGLDFASLPVPRLVGVRLSGDGRADLPALRRALAERVPTATLDDHRAWARHLSAAADTVVGIGLAVTALVLVATGMCVGFATRGAVAGNRQIVEVLHLVGAKDGFIARQFQHHFLVRGLRGAAAGGLCAAALYGLVTLVGGPLGRGAGGEQMAALVGALALPTAGYGAIAALVGLVALLTAATSRATVKRTLRSIE